MIRSFVIFGESEVQPKVKAVMGSPITQVIQPGPAHFAMVEKTALHNLDELMRQDMQAARLIVSLIRLMEPGSMSRIRDTIKRAACMSRRISSSRLWRAVFSTIAK